MYRYYCVTYPPEISKFPNEKKVMEIKCFPERQYVPEIDRMVWGWIGFAQRLTPEEVSRYELFSAPRTDE